MSLIRDFQKTLFLSSYEGGQNPAIVRDEFKGKVAELSGGYIRLNNPLADVSLQTGASFTMWVKTTEDNLSGAIFSFANGERQYVRTLRMTLKKDNCPIKKLN
jgi:hypothetical protein